MALTLKPRLGYYGLQVQPTFDELLDAANKPLRIPLPDRKAKRAAFSLFRNAVLDNERAIMGYEPGHLEPDAEAPQLQGVEERLAEIQRLAAAHDIRHLEHALNGETIPASVLQVQPSPSADDAVWQDMVAHSQQHFENQKEALARHRVDLEAMRQMQGVRSTTLFDCHHQGMSNPVLQGEVPLDIHLETRQEEAPGVAGVMHSTEVPRAAPPQLPRAPGYPAVRQFTPFEELNWGVARLSGKHTGHVDFTKQGDSYESFRRATNAGHQNLW
jgi:hypothetical protein